jgi:hypothetical protein
MVSTTASITAEYSRAPRSQKRVDFCVYIDPEQEDDHEVKDNDKDKPADSTPAAREAVAALRARLPAGVINHTDYRPLRERPVAWSIETKKTGEGWDSATLQLGIWQSAHWSFLRDLVAMQGHGTGTGTGTGTDADNDVDALPGFIPGLIIQGHDWHLVASTHDGDQTVLWQKLTLGSTSSTMGIYQIVCALQVLRQWTEQTYWPWLRAVIGASSRRGPSSS